MRVPDRNNYEIWIIDWLDGNLSEAEEANLMAFLEKNPDIKEESGLIMSGKLSAVDDTMNDKELLKRTFAELEISQIDRLSIAHLENDITEEQSAELQKCIEENDKAAERFTLIQKLRLKPSDAVFTNKRKLKKTPVPVSILRIASVTAAAAAVLTFILYFNKLEEVPAANNNFLAEDPVTTTTFQEPESENQPVDINFSETAVIAEILTVTTPVLEPSYMENEENKENEESEDMIAEVSPEEYIVYEYGIPPIKIDLKTQLAENFAAAVPDDLRKNRVLEPREDYLYDERSSVEKFIARFYRQRVLKEENPSDYPIQGYEYAEAWIAALNKMWETEMALTKNTGEDGEVESVYFTAGLIKLNAKVKNYGEDL